MAEEKASYEGIRFKIKKINTEEIEELYNERPPEESPIEESSSEESNKESYEERQKRRIRMFR